MFVVNDDKSIFATRGDVVFFSVSADDNGTPFVFKAGDVVRIKVFGKKDAETVVLQKDFGVSDDATSVEIFLTGKDTKIGETISKPKDYWYEVEVNPDDHPQTIIGYDEDGAKLFRLFPEGEDIEYPETDPEDIPVVDAELDMTSHRPIENQAVARAFKGLEEGYENVRDAVAEKFVTPEMFGAIGDGVADDSTAINAMFESVFGTNVAVKFSKKTYALYSGVQFYPACNIDFNSAKLLAMASMNSVVTVLDNRDYYVYSFTNLYIDCNNLADYGIYIEYTRGNEFKNVRVENFNTCGFYLKKGNLNGSHIATANPESVKGVGVQLDGTDCNIDYIITQNCLTGVVCNGGPNNIGKIHAWTTPTFDIDNTVAFEQNSYTIVGTLYCDTVALGVKSSVTSGEIGELRVFDARDSEDKTTIQAIEFSDEKNGNLKWHIGNFSYQNAIVNFSNMTPLDMFICNPNFIESFNFAPGDTVSNEPILSRNLTEDEIAVFVSVPQDGITIDKVFADKYGNVTINVTFSFSSARSYFTSILNFSVTVLSPTNAAIGNGYDSDTNTPISVKFTSTAVQVAGESLSNGVAVISYSRGILPRYRT